MVSIITMSAINILISCVNQVNYSFSNCSNIALSKHSLVLILGVCVENIIFSEYRQPPIKE